MIDFIMSSDNETLTSYGEGEALSMNATLLSNWNETDGDEELAAISTSALVETIYIIIGTLALLGNGFVVLVFLCSPSLRQKITNMYIINQSCIDAVVSMFLIANSWLTSDVPYSGVWAVIYCKFWQSRFLLWGLLISSTYNLVLLSFERYTAIVHPLVYMAGFTRRRAIIGIILIWILGPICEGSVTVFTTHLVDDKCSLYTYWPSDKAKIVYGVAVLILKLIAPVALMVYAYGRIAVVLHNKTKAKKTVAQLNHTQYRRGKQNTIKTLAVVAACFCLCWTWNSIIYSMSYMGYHADFTSNSYHFSVIAVYINSCINPFIYAVKYRQFQRAAAKLVCRTFGFSRNNRIRGTPVCANITQSTSSSDL